LDQLLGGSTIQTANLEKKKKDFALCQQNAWNFKYGGHCNGQITCCKKRATLGREKEKEPDIGLQNSYVKFDCMEPLFTSKHALSAVFR